MQQMTPDQQLAAAKKIMNVTGGLHEIQVQQLRIYPRFVQGIASSEARVNAETHQIFYDCKSEKGLLFSKFSAKKAKTELARLYKWTRDVVWTDVIVTVIVDGKQVFEMTAETWKEFAEKAGIKDV